MQTWKLISKKKGVCKVFYVGWVKFVIDCIALILQLQMLMEVHCKGITMTQLAI